MGATPVPLRVSFSALLKLTHCAHHRWLLAACLLRVGEVYYYYRDKEAGDGIGSNNDDDGDNKT